MGLRQGSEDEKMGAQKDYIDFEELKAEVPLEAVLGFYRVLDRLDEQGGELVGHCPFCDHQAKKKPFHANPDKNVWQCFACKRKGSIIDFVKFKESCNLKEAAVFIKANLASREFLSKQADRVSVPAIIEHARTHDRLRKKEQIMEEGGIEALERVDRALEAGEINETSELPSVLSLDQANRLVLDGVVPAQQFVVLCIPIAQEQVQQTYRDTLRAIRDGRGDKRG